MTAGKQKKADAKAFEKSMAALVKAMRPIENNVNSHEAVSAKKCIQAAYLYLSSAVVPPSPNKNLPPPNMMLDAVPTLDTEAFEVESDADMQSGEGLPNGLGVSEGTGGETPAPGQKGSGGLRAEPVCHPSLPFLLAR